MRTTGPPGDLQEARRTRPGGSTPARAALSVAALALLVAATLDAAGLAPRARFVRERIVLTVRARELGVEGWYVYANPSPLPRTLAVSVPWAADEGQAPPAAIDAARIDAATGEETPLPVVRLLGTPRFSVELPARGKVVVRVRFEQRATRGRATYLLTTTRPWGRALERGEYVLRAGPDIRLVSSSYALEDGVAPAERGFTRVDFLPDRDWSLTWETARPSRAEAP